MWLLLHLTSIYHTFKKLKYAIWNLKIWNMTTHQYGTTTNIIIIIIIMLLEQNSNGGGKTIKSCPIFVGVWKNIILIIDLLGAALQ